MRIAIWQHPTRANITRAYLNNLPCLPSGAKAFLAPAGKGVALTVQPPNLWDEVAYALVDAGVIGEPDDLASLPFSEVQARASAPQSAPRSTPKAKTAGGAFGRAPARDAPGTRLPEAEALDLSSIPVPDPVVLRIDHREPDALFAAFEGLPNVTIERVELPVGDIEINGRYLVERKSCTETTGRTDFEASVVDDDKRLFFQSEKLRLEPDCIPIVLLEGPPHEHSRGMLVQAVDGMVSFLISIQRLSVITTYSLHHTAYMLLKLAAHDQSGLGYEIPLRANKPRQHNDQLVFVLQGLPGVSANMAVRLAERFGSLAALASASDAELLQVAGMGPKRLAQIKPLLQGV